LTGLELGKPNRKIMAGLISRFTGAKSGNLAVGPRPGVDVSILRVTNRKVMVLSCDPVSFIPSIGPEASAAMSAYEVASDVATSGIPPKYAMIDLNLPPHLSDQHLTRYWKSFHETCLKLGLSIVGGHTGRFEGCDYSVIGGATLWTFCGADQYVTSMMAGDGEDIIITKSAAYGTTGVLTRAFPQTVRKALGSSLFERARKYFLQANTVKDAITAASGGIHSRGVTAMHDATEGGVVAALCEIAEASRLGGTIFLDEVPITEETRQLCRFFRIDPLVALGEGSLVVACKPDRTKAILGNLLSNGIPAAVVGQFSSKVRGLQGVSKKGRVVLRYPTRDPYWQAYWKAVRRGWS
jgi:hydrogenase expression/formation protein HypE